MRGIDRLSHHCLFALGGGGDGLKRNAWLANGNQGDPKPMTIYRPEANEYGQKARVCGKVNDDLDHRKSPVRGLPVVVFVATPAVIGVMAAMSVMAANADTDAAQVDANESLSRRQWDGASDQGKRTKCSRGEPMKPPIRFVGRHQILHYFSKSL